MQYDAQAIEFFECGEALGPHEKNVMEPLDEKAKGEDAFGEEISAGETNCDVADAGAGVEAVSTDIASNGLLLLAGAAEFCMHL